MTTFSVGTPISSAAVNAAFAAKADAANGSLTTPTITGGTISGTAISGVTVTATGSTTARSLADRFPLLSPLDFGAYCDAQQYGFTATTSGTALTVNTAKFALTDVGSHICIAGAGTSGAMHVTTIAAFVDTTHVTLTDAAPTALAAATGTEITWGKHDDTVAIQAALDRAATAGGTVNLTGISFISAPLQMRPLISQGGTPSGDSLHFANSPGINFTSDSGGTLVAIASMAYMIHPIYNSGITGGIAPFYADVTKLTLNGCDLAVIGISSEYCMHNTYRHNRIFNVTTGIQYQGYGGVLFTENVIRAATCIKLGTNAIPGGGDTLIQRNDFYPGNGVGTAIGIDMGPFSGDTSVTCNTFSRHEAAAVGTCIGVRLSGDAGASGAVNSANIVIDNNEFYSPDYAIYGRGLGAGASLNVWNVIVTGNHADGSSGTCVFADMQYCDDIIITNNFLNGKHLVAVTGPAIQLSLCSRIAIKDNIGGNYTNSFVQMADTIDCEVTGNILADVGRSGAGAAIVNLTQSTSTPVRNVVSYNHFIQTSGSFAQNGVVENAGVDFTIAVDNVFSGVTTKYTKVGASSQMGTVAITGGTIAGITAFAASGTCAFGGSAQAVGQNVLINTAAGFSRSLVYSTAGGNRWVLQANSAAEAGANAGTDFVVQRYDDAAGFLSNAVVITRSTGKMTVAAGIENTTVGLTTPLAAKFTTLQATSGLTLSAPTTQTGTTYTVLATDTTLILNPSAGQTLTLGTATAGRVLYLKLIAAFAVISASSNVVPQATATAGTAILSATAGKWCVLQGDGTNWQILMSN